MLPGSVLSTQVVEGQFVFPRNVPRSPLVDYEYGGVALQDSSEGLRFQVWRGEYLEGQILLSANSVPAAAVLTIADVSTFGFTFDQNMQPFVTYELTNGNCYFYWFDSTLPAFVTTQLPVGSRSPRCCLDDNRDLEIGVSDVIVAYCRGTSLYFRAQRDRYTVEYTLSAAVAASRLLQIGMNTKLRLQFQLSL